MVSDSLSDKCFEDFRELVHKITGITLDPNRKVMLVGRIRRRVQELGLSSYEDYLELVATNRSEEVPFVNLVTTNETYFYRTPRVWDFIENQFLPSFEGPKAKVWSAASSKGDEAHTLGIVLENFKDSNSSFTYSILGTDISNSVVKTASEGLYKGRSIQRFRHTRPELFSKYMIGNDQDGYRVIPKIKGNIDFRTHNLFKNLTSRESFDLILLRNVLIYFSKEDQCKVLDKISTHLNPNGFLVIGESETLSRIETDFEVVSPLIYRKKEKIGKAA